MSAVLQQGLDMLRRRTEAEEAETKALRALLDERREGPFVSMDEFDIRTDAMIARKRREHGF